MATVSTVHGFNLRFELGSTVQYSLHVDYLSPSVTLKKFCVKLRIRSGRSFYTNWTSISSPWTTRDTTVNKSVRLILTQTVECHLSRNPKTTTVQMYQYSSIPYMPLGYERCGHFPFHVVAVLLTIIVCGAVFENVAINYTLLIALGENSLALTRRSFAPSFTEFLVAPSLKCEAWILGNEVGKRATNHICRSWS